MELPTASEDGGCMGWWPDAVATEEESRCASTVLGEAEENEEEGRDEEDSEVVHSWSGGMGSCFCHRCATLVGEGGVMKYTWEPC